MRILSKLGENKKLIGCVLAATLLFGGVKMARKSNPYLHSVTEAIKMMVSPIGKSETVKTAKMVSNSTEQTTSKDQGSTFYMDTHMHLFKPENYQGGIEEIVDKAMERVEGMVVMVHEQGMGKDLSYETFKEEVKKDPKYEVIDHGKYLEVKTENDSLIAVKAQEIGQTEDRHVLAIGCDGKVTRKKDMGATLREIKRQNGIAIIAHPMTRKRKGFPYYGIATKKEVEEELDPFILYADGFETFNSQNYLWLCQSNVKAEQYARKYNLPGTAGSDTHGNLKQIGLAGIIIDQDQLSADNFIEDLRTAIRNKKFKTHEEYTDPISFYNDMVKSR